MINDISKAYMISFTLNDRQLHTMVVVNPLPDGKFEGINMIQGPEVDVLYEQITGKKLETEESADEPTV